MTPDKPNVADMVTALREFRELWQLDAVTASKQIPTGDTLTLEVNSGGLVTIRNANGDVVVIGLET